MTLTRGRTKQRIDPSGEPAAVYGSKSAVEERRLAQYQRTHERRHSQPAMTSLQCFNCMRLCRSNAGLAAHRRTCSVTHTAVSHAPEPLSIFCCPHCHLIFAAQHGLYTHLRTHHRNSVSWCSTNHTTVTHAPEPISIFCCPHCQMNFAAQHRLYSHLRTHHRNSVSWC